jgi:hypothetical protein
MRQMQDIIRFYVDTAINIDWFIAFVLSNLLILQGNLVSFRSFLLHVKIFSSHGIHVAFLCGYSLHIPIAYGHQNIIKRTRLNMSRFPYRRLSRPVSTTEGTQYPAHFFL